MTDGGQKTPGRCQASQDVKTARQKSLEDRWSPVLDGRAVGDAASTEAFQRAYDETHRLFIEEGRDNFSKSGLSEFYMTIAHRIGTARTVLEIGPGGHGEMSFTLARRGNTVIGIDVSEVVLDNLRSKLAKEPDLDLRFELGDARALHYADGTFDYVVSTNLVEHLSEQDGRRHMREVWRVLKDDGCYLFFVPSRVSEGYRSAGLHLHMYSLREALQLASSLGYRARWIEPAFRHLGIGSEVPFALTQPFLWYEKGLELLRSAFPRLKLSIGRYEITPTVMVAAHKIPANATRAATPG
jgi:ubiquinone/menaquinone biosynthesis C-methylase UbiE